MTKNIISVLFCLLLFSGVKAQIENKKWCYVFEKNTTLQDYKRPNDDLFLKLNSKDNTYTSSWIKKGKYKIKGNSLTLYPDDETLGSKEYRFSIIKNDKEALLCLEWRAGSELISTLYFIACPPFE